MAPFKKIIAAKCKEACLKSIQRLQKNEKEYTRAYLKLILEEQQIANKLAHLRTIRDINQADTIRKNELVTF